MTPNTTDPAKAPPNQFDALSFISDICGQLKKIKRTGWVRHKVPLPESDSDHMHRCAMCALLLSQPPDPRDDYSTSPQFHPDNVDKMKLLKMAVTHDLCESLGKFTLNIGQNTDNTQLVTSHHSVILQR